MKVFGNSNSSAGDLNLYFMLRRLYLYLPVLWSLAHLQGDMSDAVAVNVVEVNHALTLATGRDIYLLTSLSAGKAIPSWLISQDRRC